ncbi:hypothetical protein VTO73DRAFT_12231 [Trametes versicolor]
MAATSTARALSRIAIIGGGPGGLALHLTLAKRGIPATIYEREADNHSRAHMGGMLDLEWATGQRALRENGMEDVFKKYSRRDAQEMRIAGKDGIILQKREDPASEEGDLENERPEIDRRVLREILLDAVPKDSVKWDHALTSIRPLDNGEHELTFANGSVVVTDLVVGADGANSRVRPLLSSAVPLYHGITGAELSLAPSVVALPENRDINDAIGKGTCGLLEDEKVITFQRNGDGRIRAYMWFRGDANWKLPSDPKEAKKAMLDVYADWAPWVHKFIEQADESAIYLRPLYHLPVGHRWDHKAGVTLIGDAAHLMSPYAGAGANLAMGDGLDLGLVIADAVSKGLGSEERETAIAAWEEKMFESAGQFAFISKKSLELSFGPGTPHSAVKGFAKYLEQPKK